MEQSIEEQLRNIRNAVRFLAEALQGLTEAVKKEKENEFWSANAIEKVDEKLNHD